MAEDASMSSGLKPRCESGGEEKKTPYGSYITDSFPITEALDTARAKKVRPKLVYLQEIVLS